MQSPVALVCTIAAVNSLEIVGIPRYSKYLRAS